MDLVKGVLSLILLLCHVAACECYDEQNAIEARGKKKKKIALLVYFADLVLKKFFILKIVYAVVFWIVVHKAGYFLAWFVSYLKEQKKHEHHHEYHPHYYQDSYDAHGHGPYRRKNQGY